MLHHPAETTSSHNTGLWGMFRCQSHPADKGILIKELHNDEQINMKNYDLGLDN